MSTKPVAPGSLASGSTPTPTKSPPAHGAAHPQPPPTRSRWIVIARENLDLMLDSLEMTAVLSPSVRRNTKVEILETCGNRNPQHLPYLLLFERGSQARAVPLARNLDGLLAELLFYEMRALDQKTPDEGFTHYASTHLLPLFQQQIAQHARFLVEKTLTELARKWNLPGSAQARRQRLAEAFEYVAGLGASVLPEDVYPVLEAVLEAARQAVQRHGLNPEQLFADGRLGTVLRDHPAWLAFSALPEAHQEEARRWLICTLGWQRYYLPEWMPGTSLEERWRIASAPEGGES